MRKAVVPALLSLLLVVLAAIRILNASRQIAQTSDESPNIACGMQWLDVGRYDYGRFHPPLARAAIATSLYLHGYHAQRLPDRWNEGNAILHSRNDYWKALKWARAGVLPFFVIACAWVWLWGRRVLGEWGGVLVVLLFTSTPAVLAHAGIATTDMAVASGVCGALYTFVVWLDRPGLLRGVFAGATFALAFLSKFSAVLFVPAAGIAITIVYLVATPRREWPRLRAVCASFGVAAVAAALLIWAAYRFSWGTPTEHLADDAGSQPGIWSKIPSGLLRMIERTPMPAPEIVDGIWSVHNHNEAGHGAYLLGKNSLHGWWYFFPVAIAVKTPLGLLLLAVAGVAALVTATRHRDIDWRAWAPAVSLIAILLACLPASLNIGVRYVLPMYPMLAIAAAAGCIGLWRSTRAPFAKRAIAASLVAWVIVSAAVAHPDYISYFNEIASSHPEDFLVDSDLDWGQDLRRLSRELKRLKVDRIHMDCLYTGDGSELDLPSWDSLTPYQPETGWVAVSFTPLKSQGWLTAQKFGGAESPYAWLNAYRPYMRVGRSILLYYIPAKV